MKRELTIQYDLGVYLDHEGELCASFYTDDRDFDEKIDLTEMLEVAFNAHAYQSVFLSEHSKGIWEAMLDNFEQNMHDAIANVRAKTKGAKVKK